MTKKTIIFAALLFMSQTVLASAIIGSVSTATGGTGRGAIEPIDGVLLNPASVSKIKTQFFAFNYSNEQMAVTISDNGKDALFPAALAFVRTDVNNLKTQDMALVLATSILPQLSLGSTISLVEYSTTINTAEKKYRQTVADIGASFTVAKNISLGIVGYKVFASTAELEKSQQKQQLFAVGGSYTFDNFVRFRFDVESAPENKVDRLTYMAGLETYMNEWMIVRLGYQNNNVVSKNFTTAGLGFSGPQFGLHYGYLTNVSNRDEDRHTVDLGVPF